MLRSIGGQPILSRTWNRPSLLTRSNAFVRSMKARFRGFLCSLNLSCSCLPANTMSMVDLPDLNLHCDSGYTLSVRVWSRFRMTRAKQRQRSWWRWSRSECLAHFSISAGMPSLPGALPATRASIAELSSFTLGSASKMSMMGMCSTTCRASSVTVFSHE